MCPGSESLEELSIRRIACRLACLALLVGAFPALADAHRLPLTRAERAARQVVVQHHSFREIGTSRSPLVTRSCWRASGGLVRCSLYVRVPSPCELDPRRDTVCAQALWERRWLVEVKRDAGGKPAARIVRISSAPAA